MISIKLIRTLWARWSDTQCGYS